MIAYVDASALVTLFVEEAGSPITRGQVEQADAVATSRVAYVEVSAALARRYAERKLTRRELARLRTRLDETWPSLGVVEVDEHAAGTLAVKYRLRALDAIHLAAALEIRAHARDVPVVFCSFDDRQSRAARRAGFAVKPATAT